MRSDEALYLQRAAQWCQLYATWPVPWGQWAPATNCQFPRAMRDRARTVMLVRARHRAEGGVWARVPRQVVAMILCHALCAPHEPDTPPPDWP